MNMAFILKLLGSSDITLLESDFLFPQKKKKNHSDKSSKVPSPSYNSEEHVLPLRAPGNAEAHFVGRDAALRPLLLLSPLALF